MMAAKFGYLVQSPCDVRIGVLEDLIHDEKVEDAHGYQTICYRYVVLSTLSSISSRFNESIPTARLQDLHKRSYVCFLHWSYCFTHIFSDRSCSPWLE